MHIWNTLPRPQYLQIHKSMVRCLEADVVCSCDTPVPPEAVHAAGMWRGELCQGKESRSIAPPSPSWGERDFPPHLHIRVMRW